MRAEDFKPAAGSFHLVWIQWTLQEGKRPVYDDYVCIHMYIYTYI